MVRTVTVPGALKHFRAAQAVTPGMHSIVLRVGDAIDRLRLRSDVRRSVWLGFPAAELRGARDDNHRLRRWLDALKAVDLVGELRPGVLWSAVLICGWRIDEGGARVELEVPTDTVNLLRIRGDADRFYKAWSEREAECLFRFHGATRELYLALADMKRMDQREWVFDLAELRAKLGVGDKRAYARWDDFRRRVLDPAVERINALSPVRVVMTPLRAGRSVGRVRFEWSWKAAGEVQDAAAEGARHSSAQGRSRDAVREAPPLVEVASARPASLDERRAVLKLTGAADYAKRGTS